MEGQEFDRLLDEWAESCREERLLFEADDRGSVVIYPGKARRIDVGRGLVSWRCGRDDDVEVRCDPAADYIWVERTEGRRFYILCYEENR
jgi:hypothetical protein